MKFGDVKSSWSNRLGMVAVSGSPEGKYFSRQQPLTVTSFAPFGCEGIREVLFKFSGGGVEMREEMYNYNRRGKGHLVKIDPSCLKVSRVQTFDQLFCLSLKS